MHNKAGLFGAYTAGLLDDFFGVGALLWPALFAVLGAAHLSSRVVLRWWRWCGIFLLTLCLLVFAAAVDLSIGDLEGGGMVGRSLLSNSVLYLSPPGSFLLWFFIFLAGIQLCANFSWIALCEKIWKRLLIYLASLRERKGLNWPNLEKGHWQTLPRKVLEIGKKKFLSSKDWANGHLSAIRQRIPATQPPALDIEPIAPEQNQPEAASLPENSKVHESSESRELLSAEVGPVQEEADSAEDSRVNGIPEILFPSPGLPYVNDAGGNLAGAVDEIALPDAPSAEIPERGTDLPRSAAVPANLVMPPVGLLEPAAASAPVSREELEKRGQALMTCFSDFDIQGELAGIIPGPVVTMFEFRPAPGIRVSKIANLSDDLSLALKAVAVRIQAPIPGTDTVGIEIPNEKREIVNFRQLVETSVFAKGVGPLTMILGKDITGAPYLADLTRMPHMLVAGATGAGKSVCLNSILISLLYRMRPDQLKLLLVDPKRIEMAVYADLPHLVHPVVTEMEDATNALAWAVEEMENRFKTFMRLGVRNIATYHEKLASFGSALPENLSDLQQMPYMVIVIDELADLMLTAAREVEGKILRLAQLARAAGIHMILATQRPSVDVVTGLIKAQFPCRISFQVSSKHDSRTILDQTGAEHLLGRGDMLFKPPGAKLLRLHGPFLKDEEVQAVVGHWKSQQAPDYQVDFSKWGAENASAASVGGDATSDELYSQARAFVLEQGRASISLLQRHLKIGFNRAARLMEQFERDGIIGPDNGSKPRVVIRQG